MNQKLSILVRWLSSGVFVLLLCGHAFAGVCPGNPDYLNRANPTGAPVTLASMGFNNCLYADKGAGSNANSGTTEGAPFASVRGMPSCNSVCASVSFPAGTCIVLKGGSHWLASDFPMQFTPSGNSTNPVCITEDLTWFTGGSWTRPIFDCQSTQCGSSAMVQISSGNYAIIEPVKFASSFASIEMTGLKSNTTEQKYVENLSGDHQAVFGVYAHGWSHGAGSFTDTGNNSVYSGNGATNTVYMFNICDGSDTSKDMTNCFRTGAAQVDYNVSLYTYEGAHGHINEVCGNNFGFFVLDSHAGGGDHANAIANNLHSGTTGVICNNVVHDDALAPGMEDIWLCGAGTGDCTGDTFWMFGNITYNLNRGIDIGDHPSASGGTVNLYNNTIGDGNTYCVGNGESPPRSTVNSANNQCIIASGSFAVTTGITYNNLGNNLQQTPTVANANVATHFDQYNTSQTPYVYAPVASTNSTVNAGQNLSASCVGVAAPLCNDTTYATYDSTNHVVLLRTAIARGTTFDIGAFEFAAGTPVFYSGTLNNGKVSGGSIK